MRNTPYPSVKALLAAFPELTRQQAESVRDAMRCTDRNSGGVTEINSILGTHGVEFIPRGHNQRSPAITYCNAGDAYATTILCIDGRYRIGSWGDIVERGNYED